MQPLLLDVLTAAVLLFFLWRGWRKGFVLTLCGFLAVFVAFIGAAVLSHALTGIVANALEPIIEAHIKEALTQAIQSTEFIASDGSIIQLPEELPLAAVVEQLKELQLYQGFADAFQSAVSSGVTSVTTNAAHSLARFVASQLARTVIYSASFVVITFAWALFSRSLDLVSKLPVLNGLNRWGGGAVGLVIGIALVFAAAWLLQSSYLPPATVEQTFLLRPLCVLNPLYHALG